MTDKENIENDTQDIQPPKGYIMSDAEKKKRSQRNIAIALMVVGFVGLVYVVTLLRLGSSVIDRTL